MTSVIRTLLGVSVLALAVGSAACSSSGGATNNSPAGSGPTIVGTAGGTGAGGTGSGAGGGTGDLPAGIPLTPTNGWVDGMSNSLMIQGAFFSYSDMVSAMGLVSDVMTTSSACMKGVAAKVIMPCTIMAPATDCYGTYWGAAIGLNLNQPNVVDPTTMVSMGGTPVPFDASAIKGFAFDIGPGTDGVMTVPLPSQFRFNIEDATTQYCTPSAKGVKPGPNIELFTDVESMCYATAPGPMATTIQKGVVKISWQVVTNTSSTVPFDFCISNVRALPN
jgi:hypothetical protein